jgi:hypothetical protein
MLITIKYWWNKLNKVQINGMTSCAPRIEEINIIKCPRYPKWATDSMKFLSAKDAE